MSPRPPLFHTTHRHTYRAHGTLAVTGQLSHFAFLGGNNSRHKLLCAQTRPSLHLKTLAHSFNLWNRCLKLVLVKPDVTSSSISMKVRSVLIGRVTGAPDTGSGALPVVAVTFTHSLQPREHWTLSINPTLWRLSLGGKVREAPGELQST